MIDEDLFNVTRCGTPAGTVCRPRAAAARRGLALRIGTGKGINLSRLLPGSSLLVPETIGRLFILVAGHRESTKCYCRCLGQSIDLAVVHICFSFLSRSRLVYSERKYLALPSHTCDITTVPKILVK